MGAADKPVHLCAATHILDSAHRLPLIPGTAEGAPLSTIAAVARLPPLPPAGVAESWRPSDGPLVEVDNPAPKCAFPARWAAPGRRPLSFSGRRPSSSHHRRLRGQWTAVGPPTFGHRRAVASLDARCWRSPAVPFIPALDRLLFTRGIRVDEELTPGGQNGEDAGGAILPSHSALRDPSPGRFDESSVTVCRLAPPPPSPRPRPGSSRCQPKKGGRRGKDPTRPVNPWRTEPAGASQPAAKRVLSHRRSRSPQGNAKQNRPRPSKRRPRRTGTYVCLNRRHAGARRRRSRRWSRHHVVARQPIRPARPPSSEASSTSLAREFFRPQGGRRSRRFRGHSL